MICGLRFLLLLAALAAAPVVRAGWTDLAPGLAGEAVVRALGVPLVQSHGGGGRWAVWTYDAGGSVLLEHGRVTHWTPSRGHVTTHAAPGPRYVAAGGVRAPAAGAPKTRPRAAAPRW